MADATVGVGAGGTGTGAAGTGPADGTPASGEHGAAQTAAAAAAVAGAAAIGAAAATHAPGMLDAAKILCEQVSSLAGDGIDMVRANADVFEALPAIGSVFKLISRISEQVKTKALNERRVQALLPRIAFLSRVLLTHYDIYKENAKTAAKARGEVIAKVRGDDVMEDAVVRLNAVMVDTSTFLDTYAGQWRLKRWLNARSIDTDFTFLYGQLDSARGDLTAAVALATYNKAEAVRNDIKNFNREQLDAVAKVTNLGDSEQLAEIDKVVKHIAKSMARGRVSGSRLARSGVGRAAGAGSGAGAGAGAGSGASSGAGTGAGATATDAAPSRTAGATAAVPAPVAADAPAAPDPLTALAVPASLSAVGETAIVVHGSTATSVTVHVKGKGDEPCADDHTAIVVMDKALVEQTVTALGEFVGRRRVASEADNHTRTCAQLAHLTSGGEMLAKQCVALQQALVGYVEKMGQIQGHQKVIDEAMNHTPKPQMRRAEKAQQRKARAEAELKAIESAFAPSTPQEQDRLLQGQLRKMHETMPDVAALWDVIRPLGHKWTDPRLITVTADGRYAINPTALGPLASMCAQSAAVLGTSTTHLGGVRTALQIAQKQLTKLRHKVFSKENTVLMLTDPDTPAELTDPLLRLYFVNPRALALEDLKSEMDRLKTETRLLLTDGRAEGATETGHAALTM